MLQNMETRTGQHITVVEMEKVHVPAAVRL